ncbi:hypothetical protein EDC96DRAFT_531942 [Choanephora cucurbitarum]|nr:hypothetical protein EDC96DRAFT_531942 [Choanephora cucurbitarum]
MVLTLRFLQVLCIVIGQIDIKFSNAPSWHTKKTCPANRACFGALAAKITIEIQAILSCKSGIFTYRKQSVLDQKRPE